MTSAKSTNTQAKNPQHAAGAPSRRSALRSNSLQSEGVIQSLAAHGNGDHRNGTVARNAASGRDDDQNPPAHHSNADMANSDDPLLPLLPVDEFWPNPHPVERDGHIWVYFSPRVDGTMTRAAHQFATLLESAGRPFRACELRFLLARAQCAAQELKTVVDHAVQRVNRHNLLILRENQQVEQERTKITRARDKAGVVLSTLESVAAAACAAAGVRGELLEIRYEDIVAVPSKAALLAAEGVTQTGEASPHLEVLGRWSWPIIGLMWGMLSFFAFGLMDRDMLARPLDNWCPLLLSFVIGSVVAALITGIGCYAARILGRFAHDRTAGSPPQTMRRCVVGTAVAATVTGVLLVTLMDCLMSAHGLHMWDFQRAQELQHVAGAAQVQTPTLMPLTICFLMAGIFNFSFLCFTMLQTFDGVQIEDRHHYSEYLALCYETARMHDPAVAKARTAVDAVNSQAREVARLQQDLDTLPSTPLPFVADFDAPTKLRIEAARTAASGTAARVGEYITRWSDILEPVSGASVFGPAAVGEIRCLRSGAALLLVAAGAALLGFTLYRLQAGPPLNHAVLSGLVGALLILAGLLLTLLGSGWGAKLWRRLPKPARLQKEPR